MALCGTRESSEAVPPCHRLVPSHELSCRQATSSKSRYREIIDLTFILLQVIEKPPSPTTELANLRLKRSFEKVKAQVDVDLLHYSKETKLLLRKDGGSEEQQHGVLPRCSHI